MRSHLKWFGFPCLGIGLFLGVAPLVFATGFKQGTPIEEDTPAGVDCSAETPENCLDGVGSGVTSLDSLRVTGEGRAQRPRGEDDDEDVQARLRPFGNVTGRAAGDWLGGVVGLWAGYTRSDFSGDPVGEDGSVASFEADLNNVLVGIDTLVTDRLLVGVSLGYESLETDTTFNGGEQDVDGFTIAPYVAYLFNDIFSADFIVGYTSLDTDQTRIDPGPATPGAILTADFEADRAFAAVNLNAVYVWENFVFAGRVGYLYTGESQDNYVETGGGSARVVRTRHLDLGQGSIGADVGYIFGDFEPYLTGTYRNDFGRDDGRKAGGLPGDVGNVTPDDDDEFQFGGGIRYFGPNNISARFEYVTTVDRDLFEDDTFSFNVRMDF